MQKLNNIRGYDPSYHCVFYADWCDWEESGWIYIFEKDKVYYSLEGGCCIDTEDNTDLSWDRLQYLTSDEEQALEVMLDWSVPCTPDMIRNYALF